MPPKSTSAKPVSEGTRKSTRVVPEKPKEEVQAKPQSKKAPASKKRAADEPADDAAAKKPKSTKADKPASKAAPAAADKPKSAAKPKSTGKAPTSKAAAAEKPKSTKGPAAEKPKSTKSATDKPKSSKAPASGKKAPASGKKAPASKSTGAAANGGAAETIEEKPAEEEAEAEADANAQPDTEGGKELQVGDVLPSITLKNNKGADVDVSKIVDDKTGLVFFLYPKADTPGCTNQACGYRDNYDEYTKLGYKIYGLSRDKPEAQEKWAVKKSLAYELLSDPAGELIKLLGAHVAPKNTKRSHFIFEKGSGKLVDKAIGVKPADDPKNALDFIKKHHT